MIHLAPAPIVARVPSTSAWLRQPSAKWLQRDLDLATWLFAQGAAVVPPSQELPAGPHVSSEETGTLAMTFWTFIDQDRTQPVTDEEAAAALSQLHRVIRDYPNELPFLGPLLEEFPHWLHWLEQNHAVSGADLIALRQAHWALAPALQSGHPRIQPLHGDAHSGNLLRTADGLLWMDFEDACTGPVAWDVAILLSRKPSDSDEVLRRYPNAPSWDELLPFVRARGLEAVVYQQVLGRRFPARAKEMSDALVVWHRTWANDG
jgi:thiamine kinase-like enzyme